MKFCSKCKEWKELDEFSKDKNRKNGYRNECKKCKKDYQIRYRTENKDKINNWFENNKESRKIYTKKYLKYYQENNREKINLNNKKYKDKNKNIIILRNKKYYNSYILWDSDYTHKISLYEEIRQNGEYLEVKCTYCGRWYKPKIINIQARLRVINGSSYGENRFYCSNSCKKECSIYNRKKWPKGFKLSSSREVQPELRQLVLERDNYTCQKCNLTQDKLKVGLHCHHKEGILWEPLLSADIDMCITLCKTCHKEVHKIEGCKMSDMRCNK